MRLIGAVGDEEVARRFEDYLLTRGIELTIERGRTGWEIWVHNDDHVEPARKELGDYLQRPADGRYDNHERVAERVRTQKERRESRLADKHIDVRTSWAKAATGHGARPVTFALIVLCVVVFVATQFGANAWAINPLRIAPVSVSPEGNVSFHPGLTEILHGQVWRLVTPIFIHFDVWHILFNMMMLYQFGSLIEVRRGSLRLLLLILATAIPSNLLQYWFPGNPFTYGWSHPDPLFGGMSGVVYALFGYIWMKSRFEPGLQMALHPNAVFIMLGWLAICFTGLVGPIANTAHVGGLVMGLAIGIAPYYWRKVRRSLT